MAGGLKKAEEISADFVFIDNKLFKAEAIEALSTITSNIYIAFGTDKYRPKTLAYDALSTIDLSRSDANDILAEILNTVCLPCSQGADIEDGQHTLFDAEFLDLVIESVPNYLFVKDTQFRIVRANQTFLSLYPESYRDKVIGSTTIEDYDPEEAKEFLEKDREAFVSGYSETVERIQFPNGDSRILFTQKKKFTDEHDQDYILGIATDVTEREDLIKKLTKSNQDLERFAYSASHDLKSPLNAIKNLVSWIEEDYFDEFPDGAKENFRLIKSRSIRMATLLDDLLEYSRVQKCLEDEEWGYLDVVVDSVLSVIEQSDKFTVKVVGPRLKLPRVAFQIVAMNLIGNAIKHHHKGYGEITIWVEANPKGHQISFIDDGPGIPITYSKKIFEMFQTLQSRDVIEGSGMGLALAKKVLEYYEGNIVLNSTHQNGARFDLFWPTSNRKA
nr:PAS domain-containing sensor histidine kinase [Pseudoalteromonas luteoviolacea]